MTREEEEIRKLAEDFRNALWNPVYFVLASIALVIVLKIGCAAAGYKEPEFKTPELQAIERVEQKLERVEASLELNQLNRR